MIYDNENKNKILRVSIDLFAEKGFENVSMREIARHVGIKGSSIYNHYSGKEDILESILEYQQVLIESEFQGKTAGVDNIMVTTNISLEEIMLASLKTSIHTLKSPDLVKILKILSQNQLSNDKVRKYFLDVYILNSRKELKNLLMKLKERGLIVYEDIDFLAKEFHGFIMYKYYENYLLKQLYYMNEEQAKELEEEIKLHVKFFVKALRLIEK